jgi:arylsulfatase A-like enzyme
MLVILITLDCLRRDHFNEDYTPLFLKNVGDFVSFENAFSQSQNTLSSHFTMFTSNYLFQHGVYSNFENKDLPSYSIDKLLRKKDFETKAVCGISFLANKLGNQIGEKDTVFEISKSRLKNALKKRIFGERRKAENVFGKGVKWLIDKKRKNNAFLWLHLFDAHMPYYSPKRFQDFEVRKTERSVKGQIDERGWFSSYFKEYEKKVDLNYFPQCYKSAVRYIDKSLNDFFSLLKNLNIYDQSFIIVTSDHGECLMGEHFIYCAHKKLFDETINVPLFIKFPLFKFRNEKVFELVEHIDLAPTIGGLIDVEEEKYEGRDLAKLLQGKSPLKTFSFSEHVDNFMKAIRNKDYIYAERNENSENRWNMKVEENHLFKRSGEPVSDTDIELKMKQDIEKFLADKNYEYHKKESANEKDKDIGSQLKSFGYL